MQPAADDEYWRRPAPPGEASAAPTGGQVHYWGPPPTVPPPADWRPPHVIEPPGPRNLPPQDHPGLDTAEAQAQTLTHGLAILAGAILVVLLCVVCGRVLW